jgi:hypothetical protein
MAQIRVERGTPSEMLRSHGEDDLAAGASLITDNELTRIGTLGAYYAWSEDGLALRGSMGGACALSLATIDVLERTGRNLRRHHTACEMRSDGQRSLTRASVPEIVSFDFMVRRNSCPTRAAERRRIRSAGAVLCGRSRTRKGREYSVIDC